MGNAVRITDRKKILFDMCLVSRIVTDESFMIVLSATYCVHRSLAMTSKVRQTAFHNLLNFRQFNFDLEEACVFFRESDLVPGSRSSGRADLAL